MKKRIRVSYEFTFDAAHFLPEYDGPCGKLHGHTWKVRLTYLSWVDDEGRYGLDFAEIKKVVEVLKKKYDHEYLNRYTDYPSAENVAVILWTDLIANSPALLEEIRVYESDHSFVSYTGGVL